jgi:drug/metabolite transporter (DMT)-like permease
MESSIINNTMLFQIALLAWLFLGQPLGLCQVAGMVLAALGTLLVQMRKRERTRERGVSFKSVGQGS